MKTIEITEAEERVLLAALRTYQHLQIGNIQRAVEPLVDAINEAEDTPFLVTGEALRGVGRQLQAMVTGYADGGPSITNPQVDNKARIARRIEAQVTGDNVDFLYNEDGSVREPS